MSNCIKDLYDYDVVKKCSKCGIVKLKSNFQRIEKKRVMFSKINVRFVGGNIL